METVHAIYDGHTFKPLEPIPVKGQYEVTIIFNKPIINDKEAYKQSLLKYCGCFDDDDVKMIEEMRQEQRNLPKRNRDT